MLTEHPVKPVRNINFEGVTGHLDVVTVSTSRGTKDIEIPAIPRSQNWATLRYMFVNHSRKVYCDEFVKGVEALMEDADIVRWERFKRKKSVITVVKNPKDKKRALKQQEAKSWQSRIVTNARNLVRIGKGNAYGRRLLVRGFSMRYGTEEDGRGYFIMHLEVTPENSAPAKRGRKPSVKKELVENGLLTVA